MEMLGEVVWNTVEMYCCCQFRLERTGEGERGLEEWGNWDEGKLEIGTDFLHKFLNASPHLVLPFYRR